MLNTIHHMNTTNKTNNQEEYMQNTIDTKIVQSTPRHIRLSQHFDSIAIMTSGKKHLFDANIHIPKHL